MGSQRKFPSGSTRNSLHVCTRRIEPCDQVVQDTMPGPHMHRVHG